jgi:hypothetical protein
MPPPQDQLPFTEFLLKSTESKNTVILAVKSDFIELEGNILDTTLKVTDTPTESNFSDIMAGDNVINIPLFQREYKWTKKNVGQFWEDIEAIRDGTKRSQFLGVIVTVPQPKPMGVPPINDVVDGQQRLFTCYLAILAAVKVALDLKEKTWALEVSRSFLLLRQHSSFPTNTKIIPSAADRQQFHKAWYEVASHPFLDSATDWNMIGSPNPPSPSGNQTGKMLSQYNELKKRFSDIGKQKGFEDIKTVVEIIVTSLSFVTISLKDPIVAPIIFERLNSRGEKITTSDLVRNEIFAQVAHDPASAEALFNSYWKPFQESFDNRKISIEGLLFPYGLAIDPSITKAELFGKLREYWSDLGSPQIIIEDMDRFTPTLFCLELGEVTEEIPSELVDNLLKFHRSNLPSSIYSFVLKCVDRVKSGEQSPANIAGAFDVIEGFLVRRAICGFEPSGLHAVFKGMYDEIAKRGSVTAQGVASELKRRTTIPWPNDEAFREAIVGNGIYKRRICRFVIAELEGSSFSESSFDSFWIEHVVPQVLTPEWAEVFPEDQHLKLGNTLANLLPLTAKMNGEEGQNPYDKKKIAFARSKFASTRDFATKNDEWKPSSVNARADELAVWALERWPKT